LAARVVVSFEVSIAISHVESFRWERARGASDVPSASPRC